MRHFARLTLASLLAFGTGACGSSSTSATMKDSGTTGASDTGAPKKDGGSPKKVEAGASIPDAVALVDSSVAPGPQCTGATHTTANPMATTTAAPAVTVPSGFALTVLGTVSRPRELVALPNGDLLVGTLGTDVWIIPNAEASGAPNAPVLFASINDTPVQSVAFDPASCTVAIGAQHGVYTVPYADAQTTATIGSPIATFRAGPIEHSVDPSADTDTHTTTSVAYAGGKLFASVGSSCNACIETDPTRATVQVMNPDGSGMTTRATRIRNAIAVTTNPATGTIWLGGAGQDDLALGHPYEYFDGLTLHTDGVTDYGWPDCEEDQHAYVAGSDCSHTVQPLVELPAYSTLIGATFYPEGQTGTYAFPAAYRSGVFVTAHGSWHENNDGTYFSAPRVVYIAMTGDTPAKAANWSDPTAQWVDFIGGFQLADGKTRIGRPTGVAVGPQGTLFVADDQTNLVYRIRPTK